MVAVFFLKKRLVHAQADTAQTTLSVLSFLLGAEEGEEGEGVPQSRMLLLERTFPPLFLSVGRDRSGSGSNSAAVAVVASAVKMVSRIWLSRNINSRHTTTRAWAGKVFLERGGSDLGLIFAPQKGTKMSLLGLVQQKF